MKVLNLNYVQRRQINKMSKVDMTIAKHERRKKRNGREMIDQSSQAIVQYFQNVKNKNGSATHLQKNYWKM